MKVLSADAANVLFYRARLIDQFSRTYSLLLVPLYVLKRSRLDSYFIILPRNTLTSCLSIRATINFQSRRSERGERITRVFVFRERIRFTFFPYVVCVSINLIIKS